MPQAEILEALKGRVFYNPLENSYEIADRFIAGNVVQKVADVENWVNSHEGHEMLPQAKEALETLKDAVPEQIPFEDLDFNFGERWIPTGVYAAYMSRLFDTEVRITYSENIDEYAVACSHKTMKITDEFLVKGYYRHLRRHEPPEARPAQHLPGHDEKHRPRTSTAMTSRCATARAYSLPMRRLMKFATASPNGWRNSRRSSRNG